MKKEIDDLTLLAIRLKIVKSVTLDEIGDEADNYARNMYDRGPRRDEIYDAFWEGATWLRSELLRQERKKHNSEGAKE